MNGSAGLILENANVITCDPQNPRAAAIGIKAGRIQSVGSAQDAAAFKTAATRVIDCAGRILVPGFNDAHCHFFSSLRKLFSLDLSPASVRSIPEIQAALRRKTGFVPKGTWLSGADYNEFYLAEKRHPTRQDLDFAAPGHPVIITHRSLHACVLNSLGLRLVGITNETEEPPGGIIDRDLESGEPNGILYEMLPWVQKRLKSPLSQEEYRWGCRELNRSCLSLGITSFTDATVTNNLSQFEAFSSLIKDGLVQSRVNLMLGYDQLQALRTNRLPTEPDTFNPKISSLKIVISQAAGQILPNQSDLNHMVLDANQAGFQVAIHAVEQSSVEAAVIALEYAQSRWPVQDRRNRLEHCSECPPELISRLSRLKAVIVTQPPFLYYQGERYLEQVPLETQTFLYPFKSMVASGLTVAGSSDAPVVSHNPLIGIYAAAARQAQTGQILLPSESLTAPQALAMYTRNAACAHYEENLKGSIAPGLLADIVMLNADPLACPVEQVKDIQVEKTIIGGEIVWENAPD